MYLGFVVLEKDLKMDSKKVKGVIEIFHHPKIFYFDCLNKGYLNVESLFFEDFYLVSYSYELKMP